MAKDLGSFPLQFVKCNQSQMVMVIATLVLSSITELVPRHISFSAHHGCRCRNRHTPDPAT